jgi:hypothetical protein
MNPHSDYDFVDRAVCITKRIFHDSKFYISQKLADYDRLSQAIDDMASRKAKKTVYCRRGKPGDLILTPVAVYTPKSE